MTRFLAMVMLSFTLALPAAAVQPDEILKDPALEHRARELGALLRCVVCQNQSIDDSNAELARDMRLLVRDRLTRGETNDQVIDYVVERYGDFVLLNPPFKGITYVLWFGPAILVVMGIAGVILFYRRREDEQTGPTPLDADEQRRIKTLLQDKDA